MPVEDYDEEFQREYLKTLRGFADPESPMRRRMEAGDYTRNQLTLCMSGMELCVTACKRLWLYAGESMDDPPEDLDADVLVALVADALEILLPPSVDVAQRAATPGEG
jgi:hypothetical protein